MAQIVTITNPLTGQPAQADQLDHTAQQIDDAIARALPGGDIDTLLAEKEPVITTLPISKGGTGADNYTDARANLGISKRHICKAGGSIDILLEANSTYILSCSDNVRGGALLIQSSASSIVTVSTLIALKKWSYSYSGLTLTCSETDGRYACGFAVSHISWARSY